MKSIQLFKLTGVCGCVECVIWVCGCVRLLKKLYSIDSAVGVREGEFCKASPIQLNKNLIAGANDVNWE